MSRPSKKSLSRLVMFAKDLLRPAFAMQFENQSELLLTRILNKPELTALESHSQDIFELANRCLKHEFHLLGSDWVYTSINNSSARSVAASELSPLHKLAARANLKESKNITSLIDSKYLGVAWNRDHKSGYEWDKFQWYRFVPFGRTPGVDVKVPWELARCHHHLMLAYAFGISRFQLNDSTLADSYVNEFRNAILDFVANNPPRFGVNWACTMDVAIRAINWLIAYDLFRSLDEAMSYGVPVIANNVDGLKEIIGKEQSGILSNTLDPSSLEKDILKLFSDQFYREKLSANGKLNYQKYSVDNYLRTLNRTYTEILK